MLFAYQKEYRQRHQKICKQLIETNTNKKNMPTKKTDKNIIQLNKKPKMYQQCIQKFYTNIMVEHVSLSMFSESKALELRSEWKTGVGATWFLASTSFFLGWFGSCFFALVDQSYLWFLHDSSQLSEACFPGILVLSSIIPSVFWVGSTGISIHLFVLWFVFFSIHFVEFSNIGFSNRNSLHLVQNISSNVVFSRTLLFRILGYKPKSKFCYWKRTENYIRKMVRGRGGRKFQRKKTSDSVKLWFWKAFWQCFGILFLRSMCSERNNMLHYVHWFRVFFHMSFQTNSLQLQWAAPGFTWAVPSKVGKTAPQQPRDTTAIWIKSSLLCSAFSSVVSGSNWLLDVRMFGFLHPCILAIHSGPFVPAEGPTFSSAFGHDCFQHNSSFQQIIDNAAKCECQKSHSHTLDKLSHDWKTHRPRKEIAITRSMVKTGLKHTAPKRQSKSGSQPFAV